MGARRRRPRRCAAALALGAALALAACGSGQRHAQVQRAAGDDAPLHGGGLGWAAPNADLANTRWVGGPIDAASVSRLTHAWTVPMNNVSTPVVVRGVAYVQDLSATVYAIEVARGRVRWTRPSGSEGQAGPNGVAIGDGRVYGATTTTAFALDARTGRPVWTRRIVQAHEGIDMAPAYAGGTVYVSTNPGPSGYGGGVRGIVWALDGATGRPRWSWATVPPDLWGHPELNAGGGLWYTPSLDGHGGLYFGTGNPGPLPGTRGFPWGASRPGPNRWTDSLVKLDARTGRLLWARQVLPHDLYDWDLECPPILVEVHGRPLVIAGGKMGVVYAFDQRDGRLVWKRAVGLHNGHDRDNLRALDGRDRSRAPRRVLPGILGGVETPMAADRDTVYVPANNLWTIYGPDSIGTEQGFGVGTGDLVALDLATGRVRWDHRLSGGVYGAATVVNDLVFTTTYDGRIVALRTDSGKVAWIGRMPDGTNAPVGVVGDTLYAFPNIPFGNGQPIAMYAYRLRR